MINFRDFESVIDTTPTDIKIFRSLKNNVDFKYNFEQQHAAMLTAEFDPTVDSYHEMNFLIEVTSSMWIQESTNGLVLNSQTEKTFVIFSDILSSSKKAISKACKHLQESEELPVKVVVMWGNNFTFNTTLRNIDFLYKHALQPKNYRDFIKIRDLFDIHDESTIAQLKKHVSESSIYQLLFFRGLRADLDSAPITDDLMVVPSPIIRSIVEFHISRY